MIKSSFAVQFVITVLDALRLLSLAICTNESAPHMLHLSFVE